MKLTKQGVRNLDSLPSKPTGVRLAEPPVPIACRHRNRIDRLSGGMCWAWCEDCKTYLGEPW